MKPHAFVILERITHPSQPNRDSERVFARTSNERCCHRFGCTRVFFYGNCSAAIGGVGPRRATAPPTAFQDQNDSSGQLNPVGDSNSDDDPEESAYGAARTSQRPEVDGDHKTEAMEADLAAGENGVDEEGRQESKSVAGGGDKEPPFPQGSFFFKVDNKDKGHYRVRDVSCFLLTSMYKRKDRVTRTPGVSLLVGKLEHPPHEEKVISALFDTDRFSERAAAQWWEDNGHRFEDASSLAEKKVLLVYDDRVTLYLPVGTGSQSRFAQLVRVYSTKWSLFGFIRLYQPIKYV